MEDIYQYILNQRHIIENEYLKIKSQHIEISDLDINQIHEYWDNLNLNIESTKNHQNIIESQLKSKIAEAKSKSKQLSEQQLFLDDPNIENLIKTYNDGTYGIINYYPSHDDIKIVKYIKTNKMEYHNKPAIIKKLISNNKFTQEAIDESYGIMFLYEKKQNKIINLNKVYLLKNGNIKHMNHNEDDTEDISNDDLNSKDHSDNESNSEDQPDKIITKIYEFSTKIILKEIIYKSNFEKLNSDSESDSKSESESESKSSLNLIEKLQILNQKKSLIENLFKITKKYKNYIDINVSDPNIKIFLNNFSFIRTLLKKITDPTNQILNLQMLLDFNYEHKLDRIKISNRLDLPEYENLIQKYFDDNIQTLTDNILELYDINNYLSNTICSPDNNSKFDIKKYMYIYFDIIFRIYIDNYLGNKSYCLSKNLSEYFNLSAIMSEPDTPTMSLRKRHWTNLFESEDTKKIVSSLLVLINTKTKTLDQTLKYFESLFKDNIKHHNY
jgi:hypothetical protein